MWTLPQISAQILSELCEGVHSRCEASWYEINEQARTRTMTENDKDNFKVWMYSPHLSLSLSLMTIYFSLSTGSSGLNFRTLFLFFPDDY